MKELKFFIYFWLAIFSFKRFNFKFKNKCMRSNSIESLFSKSSTLVFKIKYLRSVFKLWNKGLKWRETSLLEL